MLLISNGRVIDPATGTDAPRDILLDGDRIAAVAPQGQLAARAKGAEIFDAANLIVAPGFIDLHCHLREPGGESSETIETGTRAAARGGFTAVCPLPNTRPVNDNVAVMREGKQSVRLGLRGMPAATESLAVARDVQVGELTNCRLHIAHLSARASLELVRAAKAKGLPVTCEVTPHHFTLTDDDVQYDTRYKMNPPLASREDRDALIAGLADGTVDAIATDHAPHEPALKDVEFDRAPFGVTGFETALALGLDLVHAGRISLMRLVELFTSGPARALGMTRRIAENEPGDLTIFSTGHNWTFLVQESASKSRNSPFDGRTFRGAPMATIVAGRIAYQR